MASSRSPTQRSLEYLRELGYHCEIVEKWNSFTKQRKDLWGWCDLIGYTDSGVFVGIEVKKIGDKLSIEQIERLKDIYASGGFSYICTENTDNEPILISWGEMKF